MSINSIKWHLKNYKELHGKYGKHSRLRDIRKLEKILGVEVGPAGNRFVESRFFVLDPSRLGWKEKYDYLAYLRKIVQMKAIKHWNWGRNRYSSKVIKYVEKCRDYYWCYWNEFLVYKRIEWEAKEPNYVNYQYNPESKSKTSSHNKPERDSKGRLILDADSLELYKGD